jgi:hypothetical protein
MSTSTSTRQASIPSTALLKTLASKSPPWIPGTLEKFQYFRSAIQYISDCGSGFPAAIVDGDGLEIAAGL